MMTQRIAPAFLVIGALVAFAASALAFAGILFRVDVLARALGGTALGLMAVWFLILRRTVKRRTENSSPRSACANDRA